jgi:serine/threonine protein kinase
LQSGDPFSSETSLSVIIENNLAMSHEHQREVAIFDAALQLPADQREAYLHRTCGDDLELLQRVRSLLDVNEAQTDFLTSDATAVVSPALSEKPGDRIGPYKLLQVIGEGGCGVVYMAEQDKPIHRRVALKIIKLGMDTKQVIARFEAERQALALMDHPNIAKVHDAGATATGRPYFVMELVRGVKITDYCDQKKLPTRQRLELFIQVCQAVQHAHQKGIIHRDLKPSNILVSVNDGVAVAKVIDFGIAKATTGERLTDKTLFTAFEQFIGTPAYMSPEQAEITSLDIDTRSDIYSLGVLLYELLTGKTPFDAKELLLAGLDEMRRTLREMEPARPSTRLSTLGAQELSTAATRRGLDAPKLVSLLQGDLDWIVMKCLEKDRARRYETASALGKDIHSYLHDEPVLARPPSRLYQLKKTVRRNKLVFTATGAVAVSLVLGISISSWLYLRERAAREEQVGLRRAAEAAQHQAEIERDRAAAESAKKEALSLSGSAASVSGYGTLSEAETKLRDALVSQTKILGSDDETVTTTLYNLAYALERQGKVEEAESTIRGSLAEERAKGGDERVGVLRRVQMLVDFLDRQGRQDEAEKVVAEIVSPVIQRYPKNANLLGFRAERLARHGHLKEALSDFNRCHELGYTNTYIFHRLASLLAITGDRSNYRRLCQEMLTKCKEENNPAICDVMAKDCLIIPPPSEQELTEAARLADRALAAPSNHFAMPWFQLCKGLAEYRRGRPAEALRWAQKGLAGQGSSPERDALAYILVAMSEFQIGLGAKARTDLSRGAELANRPLPTAPSWPDFIVARILLEEAEALINNESAATGPTRSQE